MPLSMSSFCYRSLIPFDGQRNLPGSVSGVTSCSVHVSSTCCSYHDTCDSTEGPIPQSGMIGLSDHPDLNPVYQDPFPKQGHVYRLLGLGCRYSLETGSTTGIYSEHDQLEIQGSWNYADACIVVSSEL